MLYLGIDQHKRQLTVNLRSEDGSVILKRQVSTEWTKVRAFFADLAEKAKPEGGFLAILEVCGMNPWLQEMLKEYGCREIVVTQPTERAKQKTDRRDASELAHLLWVHRQQFLDGKHPLGLRRIVPPTAQESDDRQITALRGRLTKKRTAILNGIHKILRKHNLEQECPTKKFQTQKVRRWLTEVKLPAIDRLEMNLLVQQWALQTARQPGKLRRLDPRLPQLGRSHATPRIDHQARKQDGALPAEPGRGQSPALRWRHAQLVQTDQEAPRGEDCAGGGHAPHGDHHLAHAQAEGEVPLRFTAQETPGIRGL